MSLGGCDRLRRKPRQTPTRQPRAVYSGVGIELHLEAASRQQHSDQRQDG